MSTDFHAFIEYDTSELSSEPFSTADISSLAWDTLCLDKDYPFISCIARVRESKNRPLIEPRGLPQNLSIAAEHFFTPKGEVNGVSPGWLYLDELEAALAYNSVTKNSLTIEYQLLLAIIEAMEQKLGHHRVRLVFSFD